MDDPYTNNPIPIEDQLDSVCDICYTDDFLHTVNCPRFDTPIPEWARYSDVDEMTYFFDEYLDCE